MSRSDVKEIEYSRLRLLSDKSNPRSRSGLATLRGAPEAGVFHFKRTDSWDREVRGLLHAGRVEGEVANVHSARVVHVVPEERLFTTVFIDRNQTLFNWMLNKARGLRRKAGARLAGELGKGIGGWLRAYHRISLGAGGEGATFDNLRRSAGDKLEILKRKPGNPFLSPAQIDRLEKFFQRKPTYRSGVSLAGATIHGDFSLSNILIDRRREAFVVDFGDTRIGLRWEDVARMYHEAALVGECFRRSQAMITSFLQEFLDNYGLSLEETAAEEFQFLRAWNSVCAIATVQRCAPMFGLGTRRLFAKIGRANVRWLKECALGWEA